MKTSIFIGDIADAEADAVCTSTNPRLSLVMGTGAAVRGRGGYQILRECEAIARQPLPAGTAWATTAGTLPFKVAIHCVASDGAHRSSERVIRSCVRAALEVADQYGCESVAMPVFASGHAHFDRARALDAMKSALAEARTNVQHVVIVIRDEAPELEPVSSWLSDEDDSRW